MLVLSRKTGESILIDGSIRVTVSVIHGDRVKIGMSGKFLPFKYYGATGNAQTYGYKEE